jgi:hypothetical protein
VHHLAKRSTAVVGFMMAASTASCLLTSDFDGLTGHQAVTGESSPSTSDSGGTTSQGGNGGSSEETGGSGGSTSSTTSTTGSGGGIDCAHPTIDGDFPSTCVLDNFNRADNASVGVSWFTPVGSIWSIKNNQLYIPAPPMGQTDAPGAILWGDIMGANQEVFVTFSQFTTMDGELELLLKGQSQAEECDGFQVWYDASKDPPVVGATECTFDGTNPVFTQFMVPTAEYEETFNPGDVFGARFSTSDGSLRAYHNGRLFAGWDASGSAYAAMTGRIGLETDGLADAVIFDDFGGGGN